MRAATTPEVTVVQIRKIVVPTDFSKDAEAALDYAIDLAKTFGGSVHLVHAYQLPVAATPWEFSYPAGLLDDIKKHAEQGIAQLAQRASGKGVPVTTEVAPGPASIAIVEAADRQGADLLVMGTRGLTGFKHVVLGSVAERVLRHSHCPVLTVKAKA
jgi:nucleotide-binding universal stress UspA family protein